MVKYEWRCDEMSENEKNIKIKEKKIIAYKAFVKYELLF